MNKSLFQAIQKHKPLRISKDIKLGKRKGFVEIHNSIVVNPPSSKASYCSVTMAFDCPDNTPMTDKEWRAVEEIIRKLVFTGEK